MSNIAEQLIDEIVEAKKKDPSKSEIVAFAKTHNAKVGKPFNPGGKRKGLRLPLEFKSGPKGIAALDAMKKLGWEVVPDYEDDRDIEVYMSGT